MKETEWNGEPGFVTARVDLVTLGGILADRPTVARSHSDVRRAYTRLIAVVLMAAKQYLDSQSEKIPEAATHAAGLLMVVDALGIAFGPNAPDLKYITKELDRMVGKHGAKPDGGGHE